MQPGVNLPPTRAEAIAAVRRGLTRKQAEAFEKELKGLDFRAMGDPIERPEKNYVMRDGVPLKIVDPGFLKALLEVAQLSLVLLECTERGGAGASFPYEFGELVQNLRTLESALKVEPGEGEVVGELLRLLQSLEE